MEVANECREIELSVCGSQVNVPSRILCLQVMNALVFSIRISPLDTSHCVLPLYTCSNYY